MRACVCVCGREEERGCKVLTVMVLVRRGLAANAALYLAQMPDIVKDRKETERKTDAEKKGV